MSFSIGFCINICFAKVSNSLLLLQQTIRYLIVTIFLFVGISFAFHLCVCVCSCVCIGLYSVFTPVGMYLVLSPCTFILRLATRDGITLSPSTEIYSCAHGFAVTFHSNKAQNAK